MYRPFIVIYAELYQIKFAFTIREGGEYRVPRQVKEGVGEILHYGVECLSVVSTDYSMYTNVTENKSLEDDFTKNDMV